MFLERKIRAKDAKSVFFEDVNDIDIFVEDTKAGYDKVHKNILSRVLKGRYNVDKVFPIGKRDEVTKHYEENIKLIKRPTIYIIDGDLYLLIGDKYKSQRGLFVLPFYCVENMLTQPEAFYELLDEEDESKNIDDLIRDFDYQEWVNTNREILFKLFIEYAISFKLNREEPTVSLGVKDLKMDGKGNLSEIKVNLRISEIKKNVILAAGEENYLKTKNEIIEKFNRENFGILDIISGKDYIYPLLKIRFNSIVKTTAKDACFKARLAKKVNVDALNLIGNFVADV